jgi:predicted nucleic acid-binding Zn ribbon protein
VVYKSTDPEEPKRERRIMWVFFGVVTLFVLIAAAIALWIR